MRKSLATIRNVLTVCIVGILLCIAVTSASAYASEAATNPPQGELESGEPTAEGEVTDEDEYIPLVTYESKAVLYKGLSVDLPDNAELDEDGSCYMGVIDNDIVYQVTFKSSIAETDDLWDTANAITAEDFEEMLEIDGFTLFGTEEFQNDTVRVIAIYLYMDSQPEINMVSWWVVGEDCAWAVQSLVASKSDDAAAIDVARQIAMSMEVEQEVTEGKKGLLLNIGKKIAETESVNAG